MTLEQQKRAALDIYKAAKARYMETLNNTDWIAFCDAKRACMRLGVII